MSKAKKQAFTLVEILIVIAILAILAVVTFVVIDPAARINAANDTRVREDVNGIADAISLFVVDNIGALPTQNDCTNPACTDGTAIATTTEATLFDAVGGGDDGSLYATALVPSYIAAIPTEPDADQYQIGQTAAGVVLVGGTLSDGVTTFVTKQ